MKATRSWQILLNEIEKHCRAGVKQVLAVHTSTACQRGKRQGLVEDLEQAGLRDAHTTGSGVWTVSLDLPALYTPGDGAHFHVQVEGSSKTEVRQDLDTLLR